MDTNKKDKKVSGIWSKKFREIDLFDLTSFFGLDFFKFPGPQYNPRLSIWSKYFLLLKRGHVEVVLSIKAGTNTPNCLGHRKKWTPIQLAAKDGCSEVVKILAGCMDKPNAPGSSNLTPIQVTVGQKIKKIPDQQKLVKLNKSIPRKNFLAKFHFLQFQKWPKINF